VTFGYGSARRLNSERHHHRMRLGGPGLAERISHQSPAASTTTMRVKTIWDGVALPTRPTMSFFRQVCPGGIGPGRMRGVRLAPVLVRGGIRGMRSCHRRGMSRNPAGTVASSASVTSTGSSLLLRMHRDTSCRRPGSSDTSESHSAQAPTLLTCVRSRSCRRAPSWTKASGRARPARTVPIAVMASQGTGSR
jgi:hypothetical protein